MKRKQTHNERMSCWNSFTFVLFAVSSAGVCLGGIIAVSNIEQCVDDGTSPAHENGTLCNKKLVVAVTVNGDEVCGVRTEDLTHECK